MSAEKMESFDKHSIRAPRAHHGHVVLNLLSDQATTTILFVGKSRSGKLKSVLHAQPRNHCIHHNTWYSHATTLSGQTSIHHHQLTHIHRDQTVTSMHIRRNLMAISNHIRHHRHTMPQSKGFKALTVLWPTSSLNPHNQNNNKNKNNYFVAGISVIP